MKVIKSKTTGYCLGVEKTIKNAYRVLSEAKKLNRPAYSIGELIHNKYAVSFFEEQGLCKIDSSDVAPGVALIRAHGIPQAVEDDYRTKGFVLVDSTCENIVRTKKAIAKAVSGGRAIVVIGIKNHAETNTLMGVCSGCSTLVCSVDDIDAAVEKIGSGSAVSVAVQTTFAESLYIDIKSILSERFENVEFLNSLCGVCMMRKKNAADLADRCDAVVVVGGKNSANTLELADYIRLRGHEVFVVESTADISETMLGKLRKFDSVGLCSGTSTPSVVFDEICNYIKSVKED